MHNLTVYLVDHFQIAEGEATRALDEMSLRGTRLWVGKG